MFFLDLTLPSPEANLALDEALIDMCEAGFPGEILRFWEPKELFVVLGYSNHWKKEVYYSQCLKETVPILRRTSGGGTVLQGPGCLNYALILDTRRRRSLRTVQTTNAYVLNRIKKSLQNLIPREISIQGFTDLTLRGRKFSGNAQRRQADFLLFHGTFLTRFNAEMVEKFLRHPSREPGYREKRPHGEFLLNFPAAADAIKKALRRGWKAQKKLAQVPLAGVKKLIKARYSKSQWNLKF